MTPPPIPCSEICTGSSNPCFPTLVSSTTTRSSFSAHGPGTPPSAASSSFLTHPRSDGASENLHLASCAGHTVPVSCFSPSLCHRIPTCSRLLLPEGGAQGRRRLLQSGHSSQHCHLRAMPRERAPTSSTPTSRGKGCGGLWPSTCHHGPGTGAREMPISGLVPGPAQHIWLRSWGPTIYISAWVPTGSLASVGRKVGACFCWWGGGEGGGLQRTERGQEQRQNPSSALPRCDGVSPRFCDCKNKGMIPTPLTSSYYSRKAGSL